MRLFNFFSIPDGAKASIAYAFASFLTQGLGIITVPIFTRILSTSDYGIITAFNSWNSIIGVIAMLALTSGAFNIGMLDFKNDRNGFIISLLVLSNVATLIIAGVFFLFYDYLVGVLDLPVSLLLFMFLCYLFEPAKNFWLAHQRYEYRYKWPIILTITTSILASVFSLLAVLAAKDRLAEVKLWSAGFVTLSTSFLFYIYIFVKGKFKINFAYWKFALVVNTPLIVTSLAQVLLNSSDRIMISKMVGVAEAGKYGVVSIITIVAGIVWTAINGSLIPYTFEKMQVKDFKAIDKVVKPLLIVYGSVCIMISFIAPEIVSILAPPEYYEVIYIVPPISAGIFFTSIFCLFGNIELFYRKTLYVMVATVIAAIINIILNLLFIPIIGYMASAYTTLVSLIILSIIQYFFVRYIQEKKIHDGKFIFLLSVVVIFGCLSCGFLYNCAIIRYLLLFIVLFILLMSRKKIVKLLGIIRMN